MEDGCTLSEHEEANDADIYFTINLTHKEDHNANVEDVGNVNDDASDGQSITNSVDDGSIDDRKLMHVVLEDWLVSSLRNSPDQRLTWDEVLSRYRTSKSALLQSWYMSQGPEGLFYYFTTLLPGSLFICHNYVNCKTIISHSTPPTTISRTSSTNHEQAGCDTIRIAEKDASNENTKVNSLGIGITPTDSADLDANAECIRTSDNLSFISYHSYACTHSMETLSIQNDDEDYDENLVDFRDTYSIDSEDLSDTLDDQYCDYDEESQSNESIMSLSPMESPDYKNYSMKELMLYPGSVWSYNIVENHWKHYVAMWLLNVFKMNSSLKLWYDFVALEFMNTFGVTSASILLNWIDIKDIAGVAISKSTYDGELYVIQSSTLVQLQILWDTIEKVE